MGIALALAALVLLLSFRGLRRIVAALAGSPSARAAAQRPLLAAAAIAVALVWLVAVVLLAVALH